MHTFKKIYTVLFTIQSSVRSGSDLRSDDQSDRSGISTDLADYDENSLCRKVISNFASFAANRCRNAYHVYRSGVVQILLSVIRGHMMGANMESDMRQQLFDHYEKLSFRITIRTIPDR